MTPDRQGTAAPPEGDDDHRLVIHQFGATEAGFFRTCRLPRCRRARRCAGCPRPGGEADALPDSATLPPCIVTGADIRRLIDGVMDVDRIIREAWGLVPGEEDGDTAADGAGDPLAFPPPEGLPRARKPGRHGGRRARRGRSKARETHGAQETPSASAEIQNTASCDSAVSSQTKSRCGNSSSRISRPEPISQIMPPSGLR